MHAESREEATVYEFDLVLPAEVDVREVGMRDGLQLEAPVPLEAKLEMLEALVATGVRRIEATLVSPRAVPALADADQVAASWPVAGRALVGAGGEPARRRRAVDAGVADLEYVVSAADGHSRANAGRTTAEAVAAVGEIAALAHGAGGSLEVIIATAWDCPFDGRTPIPRTVDVARAAVTAGADQLCLGDTIGTTTPLRVVQLLDAVRRACPGIPWACTSTTPAEPARPTRWPPSRPGSRSWTPDRRPRRLPVRPGASGNIATEELVYMLEESGVRTGWTSTPSWLPRGSPSRRSATSCPARCTAPAAGPCRARWTPGDRGGRRGAAAHRRPARDARRAGPLRLRRHRGHRRHRGRARRFTCQSFSSLSLDPPLVAFAPARASGPGRSCAPWARFCVNVLAEGQDAVSQNFARTGTDKFARGEVDAEPARRAGVDDVVAWIDAGCGPSTTAGRTDRGGPVLDLGASADRRPLLFHRGAYGLLHREEGLSTALCR